MTDAPNTTPKAPLEGGWVLEGTDGTGAPIRLIFGETELANAYLGLAVGRHPALCDRVIDDDTVSRRHFRIGINGGVPFVEDLNSLNGTALEGVEVAPFKPTPLAGGQTIRAGLATLTVRRLPPEGI